MGFTNRRYFTRQNFELLSGGLMVQRKTLLDSFEYEIQYEHISNKKKNQSTINNGLFFIAMSFIIIGGLLIFGTLAEISPVLIIIGLIFLIIAFLARKKTVTVDCYDGNIIELYYARTNKLEVMQFADDIISSSNNFLFNKLSRIDRDLPIDSQIDNLVFLRNRKIISDEEFDNLKNQLLGRENKSKIGFSG